MDRDLLLLREDLAELFRQQQVVQLPAERGERGVRGESGPRGEPGPRGPQGERGPRGADGRDAQDGQDGATWRLGSRLEDEVGHEDDLFLLTTDGTVWVKTDGRYRYVLSIVGPQGPAGWGGGIGTVSVIDGGTP